MTESVIEIERLPLTFIAAASPERAERVSRRIRDAVIHALPSALASACGRELDRDDSYVFIDRLEVQCAVATHWADDAIAGVFAARLARALLLERDLGHALIFRDRAEYLSAFLAAAIDGGAFSRWWFAEFDGLAPLPVSAAIRTLVITEGPVAWQALARLSPETRGRVIAALGGPDAERILAAFAAEQGGAIASVTTILEALESTASLPQPSASHRLIAALVDIATDDVAGVSPRTLDAIRAIAKLVEAARGRRLHGLSRDATHASWLEWCELAGLETVEYAAISELDRTPLVEHLGSTVPPAADAATPTADLSFGFTPFGGALLLCVVLVQSGWWRAWRDRLLSVGTGERANPLAAWLALAVVARALSPDDPAAVERDGALRRVFGVPETMGVSRGPRLGRLARAHGSALLREFGRRVPGCEGLSKAYLRSQCLALPAAVRSDGAMARLGRPPLDVLVGFSGLKRASITLPDGRGFALTEDPSW